MQTTTNQAKDQIQRNADQTAAQDGVGQPPVFAPQFPDLLKIGEIIEVKGVPCVLEYVNPGKRRLSLRPAHAGTRVMDPLKQVSRVAAKPKPGK